MDEVCFRCKGALERLQSEPEITFYACHACRRTYARQAGRGMTDRWLSPISLVLYPIQFTLNPVEDVDRVARIFLEGDNAFSPAELEQVVADIRDEVEVPKQQVRDIVDVRASESDVREFLSRLADRFTSALQGGGGT